MVLTKLKKPVPDRDQVVILEQNGVADIATVFDVTDEAVHCASDNQEYEVPLGDLKSYVGPHGRIFLLAADPDYVRDTERLAELEKSIVLRQITHYQKPPEEAGPGIRIKDILLYALIGALVLGVIFK